MPPRRSDRKRNEHDRKRYHDERDPDEIGVDPRASEVDLSHLVRVTA
jgi:hypothetical protein